MLAIRRIRSQYDQHQSVYAIVSVIRWFLLVLIADHVYDEKRSLFITSAILLDALFSLIEVYCLQVFGVRVRIYSWSMSWRIGVYIGLQLIEFAWLIVFYARDLWLLNWFLYVLCAPMLLDIVCEKTASVQVRVWKVMERIWLRMWYGIVADFVNKMYVDLYGCNPELSHLVVAKFELPPRAMSCMTLSLLVAVLQNFEYAWSRWMISMLYSYRFILASSNVARSNAEFDKATHMQKRRLVAQYIGTRDYANLLNPFVLEYVIGEYKHVIDYVGSVLSVCFGDIGKALTRGGAMWTIVDVYGIGVVVPFYISLHWKKMLKWDRLACVAIVLLLRAGWIVTVIVLEFGPLLTKYIGVLYDLPSVKSGVENHIKLNILLQNKRIQHSAAIVISYIVLIRAIACVFEYNFLVHIIMIAVFTQLWEYVNTSTHVNEFSSMILGYFSSNNIYHLSLLGLAIMLSVVIQCAKSPIALNIIQDYVRFDTGSDSDEDTSDTSDSDADEDWYMLDDPNTDDPNTENPNTVSFIPDTSSTTAVIGGNAVTSFYDSDDSESSAKGLPSYGTTPDDTKDKNLPLAGDTEQSSAGVVNLSSSDSALVIPVRPSSPVNPMTHRRSLTQSDNMTKNSIDSHYYGNYSQFL